MTLKTTVAMNAAGRLTVPKAARQALHLESETRLEIEVTDEALILSPAATVSDADEDEDAWARTPEFRARLERALQDEREGRVWRIGPAQLERLIEWAEQSRADDPDRELSRAEIEQFLSRQS